MRPPSVSASTRLPGCGCRWSTSRATSRRPRRSSSPRRSCPSRGSRSTTSASTRAAPACSTCSTAWAARVGIVARRRLGAEPVGDLEVRSAELTATEIEGRRGAAARRRAAALRAARGARPRPEPRLRGRRAASEGDRPDRGRRRRAPGDRARARSGYPDGFTVTGVPARPRGGRVESRGDHRIAMLGAVAGLASREGVEIVEADSVAVSFPGFYDLLGEIAQR